MAYLKKDEIIFAQKPQPDYSGIPEREAKKYTTSTEHVLRSPSEHNQKVYDLEQAARMRNFDKIDQMEAEAQKEGKAIVWYCCESVRNILERAIDQGIRRDDFFHSFVPSFVGRENYAAWSRELGFKEPSNHQFSGYTCEGNSFLIFDEFHVVELKKAVAKHLEKLETNELRLYYLESLMNDIQHSKEIELDGGRDKYNRQIQPLNLWLEREAEGIRAKLLGIVSTTNEVKTTKSEKPDKVKITYSFDDLFSNSDAQQVALKIGIEAGIIDEANRIRKGLHNGACVVLWDTLKRKASHLLNSEIDDLEAYRLLSVTFTGKQISDRATRDRPLYGEGLRRKIEACILPPSA